MVKRPKARNTEELRDSFMLLFVIAMVCAAFASLVSIFFYLQQLLYAGGQFTLLAVVLLVMALQAYALYLLRKE